MTPVDIVSEQPASDLAAGLLRRYYDELASRFPGGFEPDQSGAVAEAELVPPGRQPGRLRGRAKARRGHRRAA
jgi:hypothetical protein